MLWNIMALLKITTIVYQMPPNIKNKNSHYGVYSTLQVLYLFIGP